MKNLFVTSLSRKGCGSCGGSRPRPSSPSRPNNPRPVRTGK